MILIVVIVSPARLFGSLYPSGYGPSVCRHVLDCNARVSNTLIQVPPIQTNIMFKSSILLKKDEAAVSALCSAQCVIVIALGPVTPCDL